MAAVSRTRVSAGVGGSRRDDQDNRGRFFAAFEDGEIGLAAFVHFASFIFEGDNQMALTHQRAKEVAEHAEAICNEAKALHYRILEFLATNSNLSIDWAAGEKPAYINEDADGNLDGLHFTRQQVANAIGSIDQIRRVLANEAVTQGDHLGNLNQIAKSDA